MGKANNSTPKKEKRDTPKLDSGLFAFVTVARVKGIPADYDQIHHSLALGAGVMSELDMLRAAKSLGLKSKAETITSKTLATLPMPLVAQAEDETYFVVAQHQGGKLLVLLPGGESRARLTNEWIAYLEFLLHFLPTERTWAIKAGMKKR
ncbi:MAG: cysteine peptidase family C39 domain-containing protein [Candidatus Saccharimonadota bacterium]